jgi:formylglycine-generating enzyme required for sulfatase activity
VREIHASDSWACGCYSEAMTTRVAAVAAVFCAAASSQEMVRIPAGEFDVVDQVTTLKLRVTVSEFLLGATEVTQNEYLQVTGRNPSFYKGPDRPVENVSWWDAIRFCNLHSLRESLTPCYDLTSGRRLLSCAGYRLPTEAEWTRAAGPLVKGNSLREVAHLGDTSTNSLAVFDGSVGAGTSRVRSLKPNEFGVYDMRGNVWEWCDDWFSAVISPSAVHNPSGPLHGLAARYSRRLFCLERFWMGGRIPLFAVAGTAEPLHRIPGRALGRRCGCCRLERVGVLPAVQPAAREF